MRGLNQKVLREYEESAANAQTGERVWTWTKDYIYRGSLLAAAITPTDGMNSFHLDHLGTARLVTDEQGYKVALHDYYPFGDEATTASQADHRLKFTGHERDYVTAGNQETRALDYMHARYYSPAMGRFLSVDPMRGSVTIPQSWNRYPYVRNNPLLSIDPDGRRPAYVYGVVRDVEPGYVVAIATSNGNHVVVVADFASDGMGGMPNALILENAPVTPEGRSTYTDTVAHVPAVTDSNDPNAGAGQWNKNTATKVGIIKNTKNDGTHFTSGEVKQAGTFSVTYSNTETGTPGPVCDCSGYVNQVVNKLGGTVDSKVDKRGFWARVFRRPPQYAHKNPEDWARESQ